MKKISLISATFAVTKATEKNNSEKCRILSFHGGGIHGSFEAGALKALVEHMPAGEVQYDIIAGVSIGAYNAALFALYPPGEEKQAVDLIFQ